MKPLFIMKPLFMKPLFNGYSATALILVALVTLCNPLYAQRDDIDADWPDSRYIIHSDNTVTDTRTNLMWQRCSVGQDQTTVGCTGTAKTNHNWQQALATPTTSSNQIAGYTDWRLPNIAELRTLAAYDRTNPAINATIFPSTTSANYASSTPSLIPDNNNASLLNRFWGVQFDVGSLRVNLLRNGSTGYSVRLVRGP